MVCEEAVWAGDNAANSALKHLITDATMMLEPKGIDSFEVSNYCRIGMISNEDWVIPAGMPTEERRYFVLNVSDSKQKQYKYFQDINDQMEDGGIGALMHELMTWNPPQHDAWACLRNPPITEGLRNQAMESMNDLDRFFIDMVRERGLYEQNEQYLLAVNLRENEETRVPRALLKRHFTHQLSRSVQSTARSKAGSTKAFGDAVKKYLFLDDKSCKNLSFKDTPFGADCADVNANNRCARGYVVPPLKLLREKIKDAYEIDIEHYDEQE